MVRSKEGIKIEIAVYEDLIEMPKARTFLGKIGVDGTKHWHKKIHHCRQCESSEIIPLQILGAHDEPLFWDCNNCGYTHLRFTKGYTEQLLKKASKLWSNPNDWGVRGITTMD